LFHHHGCLDIDNRLSFWFIYLGNKNVKRISKYKTKPHRKSFSAVGKCFGRFIGGRFEEVYITEGRP